MAGLVRAADELRVMSVAEASAREATNRIARAQVKLGPTHGETETGLTAGAEAMAKQRTCAPYPQLPDAKSAAGQTVQTAIKGSVTPIRPRTTTALESSSDTQGHLLGAFARPVSSVTKRTFVLPLAARPVAQEGLTTDARDHGLPPGAAITRVRGAASALAADALVGRKKVRLLRRPLHRRLPSPVRTSRTTRPLRQASDLLKPSDL